MAGEEEREEAELESMTVAQLREKLSSLGQS